ncbi:MAG: hypothetical protein HYS81_03695 [Candidatus Aenigmatarchaeota archaeon]|nr:MAG: hypothetical protein HYS81_03695 [Candidatus Aenigmarchaeota archaeon]
MDKDFERDLAKLKKTLDLFKEGQSYKARFMEAHVEHERIMYEIEMDWGRSEEARQRGDLAEAAEYAEKARSMYPDAKKTADEMSKWSAMMKGTSDKMDGA